MVTQSFKPPQAHKPPTFFPLLSRPYLAIAASAFLSLAISGCGQDNAPAKYSDNSHTVEPDPSVPALPRGAAPVLTAEEKRGQMGAEDVLRQWARALERGDYNRAYAQFGDAGAASGMSRDDHAKRWSQFKHVEVTASPGTLEGAAGTSYYRAPVTISAERLDGTPVHRQGQVTLARVNDVPGATPAQLRWHLVTSELTKSL